MQRRYLLITLGVQLLFAAILSSSCASNRPISGAAACVAQAPQPKVLHASRRSKMAAPGYGELQGSVFVGDHAVDQAVINLVDSTGKGHRGRLSAYSNSHGRFSIARVQPGIYELEAWAPGFTKVPRETISIRRNRAVSIAICLVRDPSSRRPPAQEPSSNPPPRGE